MKSHSLSVSEIQSALHTHETRPDGATFGHFSVMALLFETEHGLELLFCKRAMTLKHQPGDVCFPGGRQEGEETPLETALREMEEEIGLKPENVEILGETDFIVTMYNAYVRPFVAVAKGVTPADIRINPEEVDKFFTVPLKFFQETEPLVTYAAYEPVFPDDFPFHMVVGGTSYSWGKPRQVLYFYQYGGEIIWGLTARITRNLCAIAETYLQQKAAALPSE